MRVLGVDPGTVSFDVCGLEDGEVFLDLSIATADLADDPARLAEVLRDCGPVDLIVGPSGYGLPLVWGDQVGARELALMVLVRHDEVSERVGILGMRRVIEALIATGLPVVFAPGAIHLPTIPAYRKANRIDMGTADKVCSAALGIYDQARRYGIPYAETSFILLELGGAFTAALAIDGGKVVDGMGGSSGPIGLRAAGAMDGEVAYLIGGALSKATVFSGGAIAIAGVDVASVDLTAWPDNPRYRTAWLAWLEGAVKAVLALTAVVPRPREILLSGRLGQLPRVRAELAKRLAHVAPVRSLDGLERGNAPVRVKAAAQGAALLADGLVGGRFAPLVEVMELRRASGTVFDYLYIHGAETIRIR